MRKSSVAVTLGLLALAAPLMTGCDADVASNQDVRACIDQHNKVVDEKYCSQQHGGADFGGGTQSSGNSNGSLLQDMLLYHWIFGGSYNNGYAYGYDRRPRPGFIYVSPRSDVGSTIVRSGSASVARSATISRGGFGGGFGGGEGAGE